MAIRVATLNELRCNLELTLPGAIGLFSRPDSPITLAFLRRFPTAAGSPWQNVWIESFNGRLRDELLNGWQFDNLLEAQVLIEDGRVDYKEHRPHSAHGDVTPERVRASMDQPKPTCTRMTPVNRRGFDRGSGYVFPTRRVWSLRSVERCRGLGR